MINDLQIAYAKDSNKCEEGDLVPNGTFTHEETMRHLNKMYKEGYEYIDTCFGGIWIKIKQSKS
jgi:hypothetical protein